MMMKAYSELILLPTFAERFQYLKLKGAVGKETFGKSRYLNQLLYRSPEWKKARRDVIIRDGGCDLGVSDCPIDGRVYIHHMNPITEDDILNRNPKIFDPNNLISVSFRTHQAIHYGSDEMMKELEFIERTPGDTKLW